MNVATKIESIEIDLENRKGVADDLAINKITHSPHIKDWVFRDGSILRLNGESFSVIKSPTTKQGEL